MPNMLTKEDLKQIGEIVEDVVERVVDRKLDEKLNDPEGILNVKFGAVQERIESLENRMITKSDLEHWEFGLTERYDQRYVRR